MIMCVATELILDSTDTSVLSRGGIIHILPGVVKEDCACFFPAPPAGNLGAGSGNHHGVRLARMQDWFLSRTKGCCPFPKQAGTVILEWMRSRDRLSDRLAIENGSDLTIRIFPG